MIGLTGGIASGKSTVVRALRRRGVTIVDADRIAREVVRPGQPVWRHLLRLFGDQFFSPRGRVNRRLLGAFVFQHPSQRRLLERITHPAIIRHIQTRLRRAQGMVVLDAPLLFEAGLTPLVDEVVVVWAPPAAQLRRLKARNRLSHRAAWQRIRAQGSLERKRRYADVVLDNSGSRVALLRQVRALWQATRKKALTGREG